MLVADNVKTLLTHVQRHNTYIASRTPLVYSRVHAAYLIYQALHHPSGPLAHKSLINLLFLCYRLICHGAHASTVGEVIN